MHSPQHPSSGSTASSRAAGNDRRDNGGAVSTSRREWCTAGRCWSRGHLVVKDDRPEFIQLRVDLLEHNVVRPVQSQGRREWRVSVLGRDGVDGAPFASHCVKAVWDEPEVGRVDGEVVGRALAVPVIKAQYGGVEVAVGRSDTAVSCDVLRPPSVRRGRGWRSENAPHHHRPATHSMNLSENLPLFRMPVST